MAPTQNHAENIRKKNQGTAENSHFGHRQRTWGSTFVKTQGRHDINELQKTTILGTAHFLRRVLM
jgi:hypothetical protein